VPAALVTWLVTRAGPALAAMSESATFGTLDALQRQHGVLSDVAQLTLAQMDGDGAKKEGKKKALGKESSTAPDSSKKKGGLSTWAIVGIVAGVVVLVLVIVLAAMLIGKRRKPAPVSGFERSLSHVPEATHWGWE
jgi:hypothetical protein